VLQQCPELIINVCIPLSHNEEVDTPNLTPHWPLATLLAAFERLAKQTYVSIKICLFVDGPDEYNGNSAEICRLFKSCASSNSLEFCVSSRPWNAFENAFGANQEKS
jgi:hypothetical protein